MAVLTPSVASAVQVPMVGVPVVEQPCGRHQRVTHPDCKEVTDFAEGMRLWQQLQDWQQPHSYPVPGRAEDGSPVWHLWGKPSWMTGERAAEACRVAPGWPSVKKDPPKPPTPKPVKRGQEPPKADQRKFF